VYHAEVGTDRARADGGPVTSSFARLPQGPAPLFAALALSPEPVFVTDRQNRIVCWNRSAEHMLGYSEEEALGASCAELLQGCDVHDNRYCSDNCPITLMAARSETVHHFGLQLRARDGGTVAVDVSILTFVMDPADRSFLAHILTPSDRARAAAAHSAASPPPHPLVAAQLSADARARKLTAREVEVLGMLAAGRTTPEMAERLHISTLTARNHVQNILDKLEVHSKAEAVAFAFQKHLL
jgi:PAS domain S-box-containing protein